MVEQLEALASSALTSVLGNRPQRHGLSPKMEARSCRARLTITRAIVLDDNSDRIAPSLVWRNLNGRPQPLIAGRLLDFFKGATYVIGGLSTTDGVPFAPRQHQDERPPVRTSQS